MPERIIYSMLCSLRGSPGAPPELLEMARLWAEHLRGPGRFAGRAVLLTNLPDLEIPGVESIEVPSDADDRRRLFLDRVLLHDHLPVAPGDRVMQLDLDALATGPLDPLFEAVRGPVLFAAPSRLSPLHPMHSGALLSPARRLTAKLAGWERRPGVSASVTCCMGEYWPLLMGRWGEAAHEHGAGEPPPLGDQSLLNLLHVTGRIPVRRFPEGLIYHVRADDTLLDEDALRHARVVHFPIPDRLAAMRRVSTELTAPPAGTLSP